MNHRQKGMEFQLEWNLDETDMDINTRQRHCSLVSINPAKIHLNIFSLHFFHRKFIQYTLTSTPCLPLN